MIGQRDTVCCLLHEYCCKCMTATQANNITNSTVALAMHDTHDDAAARAMA